MITARQATEMVEKRTAYEKRMHTDPEFRNREYKKGFIIKATENYELLKEHIPKAARKSETGIRIGVLTSEAIIELQKLGYKVELVGTNQFGDDVTIPVNEATLAFDTKFIDNFRIEYSFPDTACYKFKAYPAISGYKCPKEEKYKREFAYTHTIIRWG